MQRLLPAVALRDFAGFSATWNDLGIDGYMADGGRYRRRRFSCFAVSSALIEPKPHQPHYQSRDYNLLNGGIERWFEPFTPAAATHPLMKAILRWSHDLFNEMTPSASRPAAWHVEAHQFRIEARADVQGEPTPEGLHRDGVDWVLVLLIARHNIAEGVTSVHNSAQRRIGHFTLTEPLDTALVDDSRVYHGVTAVRPIDSTRPAYRDVLVLTYRRG